MGRFSNFEEEQRRTDRQNAEGAKYDRAKERRRVAAGRIATGGKRAFVKERAADRYLSQVEYSALPNSAFNPDADTPTISSGFNQTSAYQNALLSGDYKAAGELNNDNYLSTLKNKFNKYSGNNLKSSLQLNRAVLSSTITDDFKPFSGNFSSQPKR